MEYTIYHIIAIVIVLIIITILLVIFLPKPLCYFDIGIVNPVLQELTKYSDNYETIYNEINIEGINYENDINIIYNNKDYFIDKDRIPFLNKCINKIKDIKRVFLYVVNSKQKNPEMCGDKDISNKFIRCLLPLKIPQAKKSGIWVDGETKLFVEKEWVVYDHSKINSIYNNHKSKKLYLLVFDLDRPENIPEGVSKVNTGTIF